MPTKLIPFTQPDTWYLGLEVQGYDHQAHFPFTEPDSCSWAFRYRAMTPKLIPFPELDTWNSWVFRYRLE
jgi:hypothetical protein